ncbi:helix-turn-helix domain-containing protein [Mycobacterium simiae]|uniref:AraC-like ligand-binding domain-containing protein n=1 Tax=Mycobacterium simiae TaxID=1784 RepID=UPI0009DC4989|nr:helix-turn-helix domain-containing protein [Mycobacterium simiae]
MNFCRCRLVLLPWRRRCRVSWQIPPGGTNFDKFRHAISDTFVPLALSVAGRTPPRRWAMRSASLGAVQVTDVALSDAAEVHRTNRLINQGADDYLKVGLQLRGSCVISQNGREAQLNPGDYAVYDTTQPYRLTYPAGYQTLVLMFRRERLRLTLSQLTHVTAQALHRHEGLAASVSPFLAELGKRFQIRGHPAATHLADAILEMLTASLAERLPFSVDVEPGGGRSALLMRIHAFIEERLGDPNLDVPTIAAAHHISVRYLQGLFAAQEQTVSGWLRSRRIDRCRQDLADVRFANQPVSEIGARWGLLNPAHFSRTFKAVFGCPPTQYRAAVLDELRSQRTNGVTTADYKDGAPS